MSTDTDRANAQALPTAEADEEYDTLLTAKMVADTRLAIADRKRKAAKDNADAAVAADAEMAEKNKKRQASRTFASAYQGWLAAKAGNEEPDITDDEQPRRWRAESEAERRLFTTPSVYPDQVWQKLEAFETVLGDELASGPRRDSVLLLALGSIKQDIVNLDLLEAIR